VLLSILLRRELVELYTYINRISRKLVEHNIKLRELSRRAENAANTLRELREIREKLDNIEEELSKLEQLVRKHDTLLKQILKKTL